MLRYIIGVSLIAILIIVIRALSNGKIQKRQQYALWLAIPVYMLVAPFVKINVPVATEIRSFLPVKETVIAEAVTESNEVTEDVTEQGVPPVYNYGQPASQVSAIAKNDVTEDQVIQSNEAVTPPVDLRSVIQNTVLAVAVTMIAGIVVYNIGFVIHCKRRRSYVGRDPLSGLRIYSLGHKGTPFLLVNSIYVDRSSDRLSKYVICHEACHHKHGDFFWVILRYLVLALNWYNPVIWAVFVLSGRDCELACDEEVLKVYGIGAAKEYAQTLFGLLQSKSALHFGFTVSTGMRGGYKMMKKRIENIKSPARQQQKLLAGIVAVLLVFSGCATMNPTTAGSAAESSKETQNVQSETSDAETSGEKAISFTDNNTHIEKSIEYNGATLSINADIESIADKNLKKAKLTYDKDLLDKLNNEWVAQNYPDASKRPQVTCDLNDGIIDFTDYDKDINTWDGDSGEVIMKKGFVTDKTPLGMSTDATSAGNDAIGFIQAYSPFEYRIFNILAANDTQNNKGYYDVNLQAEYNGLPVALVKGVMRRDDVSDEAEAGHLCSIGFNIKVSKDGIFGFQGKSAMKTVDIKPVTNVVPFDNIADKCLEDMKIDIPADGNYGPGITVTDQKFEIVKVSVEYIPKNATFGDVELIPAWCCECVNSCISNGQLQTVTYYLAYSVETGELLVQYY